MNRLRLRHTSQDKFEIVLLEREHYSINNVVYRYATRVAECSTEHFKHYFKHEYQLKQFLQSYGKR